MIRADSLRFRKKILIGAALFEKHFYISIFEFFFMEFLEIALISLLLRKVECAFFCLAVQVLLGGS